MPSGYIQTFALDNDIVTQSGQNASGTEIGIFELQSFSGELFEDANQSGVLTSGDAGLPGWTVELLNGAGQVVSTTQTDSQGDYTFARVAPGTLPSPTCSRRATSRRDPPPGLTHSFPPAASR